MNEADSKEITDKINALEYKRIAPLEEKVISVQISLERNNVLTEKNVEAMEKLSNTMEVVTKTMGDISYQMRQQNETSCQLNDNMNNLSEKINKVDTKVDSVKNEMLNKINENEEKNKIDIRCILKNVILKIILPAGIVGTIVAIFIQAVQNA